MSVRTKLQELFGRVPTEDDTKQLGQALQKGIENEELARLLGIETKSADPPAPAPTPEPAQPEPTPAPQQPTEPNAELTVTEAKNVATALTPAVLADLKPALQTLIREELASQQTVATKAQEPVTKALETVQADVSEIKATLKALSGEQSAGQVYRASQAGDTIRVGADGQPIIKAQTPQPTTVSQMTDVVLGAAQQGGK